MHYPDFPLNTDFHSAPNCENNITKTVFCEKETANTISFVLWELFVTKSTLPLVSIQFMTNYESIMKVLLEVIGNVCVQ